MSKKRTQLSTYHRERKHGKRDTYGTWKDGKRLTAEVIAGTQLTYTPGTAV